MSFCLDGTSLPVYRTGQVDYYKNVKSVDKLHDKWYTIPILRIKT